MTTFRSVAHFYVGCKIKTDEGIGTFTGYYPFAEVEQIVCDDLVHADCTIGQCKPLLIPLSKISKEDFLEFAKAHLCSDTDLFLHVEMADGRVLCAAIEPDQKEKDFSNGMDDGESIIEIGENDDYAVMTWKSKSGNIWYGNDDEYHYSLSFKDEVSWFAFLISKHYNVFSLPESEFIDPLSLPVNPYVK